MNSKWTKNVSAFIIGWIVGLFIWSMIRGLGQEIHLDILGLIVSPFMYLILLISISCVVGTIFGTLQYFYEHYYTKTTSFKQFVIQSILVHILLMVGIYLISFFVVNAAGTWQKGLVEFLNRPALLENLIFSVFINIEVIIVIQINRLLGRGNLGKLITGKFFAPREEIRAFMFMDLKGSTTIAEQLGHLNYSRFIQDCFHYLSIIDDYKATIYQYVGDEVVLTWKIVDDNVLKDAIDAFYAYTSFLKAKADYFETEYGVQPIFKAGLHIGPITVVEVGNIKREIAYHGDTINVAARIQEQCKKFDKPILLSQEAMEKVKNLPYYIIEHVGEFVLRGRKKSTELYSVLPKK
ncbi:MAG: adenylate/guanylate cyclase domain-containing protein [Eudoraea sp.]|uniref:adenylate/guanylate cyclase domain-containing protein n=1 Tax=Eudoraea sp. TaxID=1979955 RepID=UPI003C735736